MRLGDTSFFNLFAMVASATNPDRTCDAWDVDHVHWTRERTSHRGPSYHFQIELHTLRHEGKRGWTLLMGHETWWAAGKTDAFRNGRWVHVSGGARSDILKWFARREAELED
jgi:hypothetical protein